MTMPTTSRSLMAKVRHALAAARERVSAVNPRQRGETETGDTLIEVLIALVVLGIAVVAMLLAFGAALSGSAEHRTLTNIATAEKTVTQQIAAQLQNANPPLYLACASAANYQSNGSNAISFTNLPSGYTAQVSGVGLWDPGNSTFDLTQAACQTALTRSNNQSAPQLISATVTYPSGGSSVVTTVVNNPASPTPPPVGTATQLYFYTQPGVAQSAQNLAPQPVVEVEDAYGVAVRSDLSDVVLSLTTANGGAVASGTTLSGCVGSENFGYVSFSGCSVNKTGSYKLVATDSALGAGYSLPSSSFTISLGPPSQIIFTQQPSSQTQTGGTAFATQPQITVEDAGGNTVTTDTSSVSLAVSTGSGPGSLSCTTNPLSAVGGVATFTGCSVNTIGTAYTLTATDMEPSGTLTTTSAAFTISVGAPAQLAFTQNPGASTGGTAFGTQPKVAIEDAGGNITTTGFTGSTDNVTLSINSGTGTLTCSGTGTNGDTFTAANGVASFIGCKIALGTAGSFVLKATDSTRTLPTVNSVSFTVAGGANKLAFTVQPTNGTGGSVLTTAPVVSIEDSVGDVVTTATNAITLSINSGTGTLTCSGTGTGGDTFTPTNGVVTFTGCKIALGTAGSFVLKATSNPALTNPTTTSNSFAVAGPASKIVFTTQPSNSSTGGVAFATQPTITVEDSGNRVVTADSSTVTLAITTGTPSSGGPGALTGCTQSETLGVITFTGCSINTAGTNYTLTAKDVETGGTLTATSSSFTITVGPAATLAFTTQPGGGANAAVWTNQPTVTVEDAGGNKVAGATNTVSLTIGSQPGTGATLGCTTNPVVASAGVATFAGCEIVGKAGTTYTLTASAPGLANGTSTPFTITVGTAYQVAFTTQPGGGANTSAWTGQPIVTVQDSGGNAVTTSTASVTLAIGENAGGTLGCTHTTVNAVAGVATFAGCEITGTAGTYTLSATSPSLASGTSSDFTITAGPATQVVFSTQPGGGADGSAWTVQPAISVEDVSGNLVGTSTANISLSIHSQPGSGAALGCSNNPLAATGGVATFAGCEITGQLGSYTLTASAPGLTGPASTAFNITIGPASQLVFSAQPGGGTDGAAWTNQPAVTIQDVGGNTVTTANNTVTLALGTNPGGTLACTGGDSLAATNGVATFAGCKITGKAGSYTLTEAATGGLTGPASTAFNITIGAASQLVFSAQPGGGANGAIWTAQPAVTIQDVGGNTVTTANNTVTLALGTNPGGTLACTGGDTLAATNGVATFAGCKITGKAGSYTLTEAATGGLTGPASTAFNITFGPASQLVFSAQPGGGTDGAAWTNQPAVTVEDASGNVVTNSAASVTLALGTNPGGTLACTGGDSLAATNGVATFAGCKITGKAGSYTLTEAATGGLTGPASTAFNITIGAASQLVFSAQPGGGANGAIWTAQPAVTIQDVGGNTVTTANNTVTLALGTNPGGTLACTGGDTLAATNGVATFAGCKITGKAGSYTLTEAATGGLTGPASTAFNITFGPASQLVFSAQPGGGTDGAAWTNQPAVTVEDASGNVVTNSAASVTLALGTNPGGTLACTGGDSLAATNGVATFAGCKITGKAGSYTLTEAATGGLTGPASTAFNITFGPASQLVFSAQPGGGTDGAAWTNQPAVTVEDASGNVVTNSAASVTLALGTNPGGTLACTGGDSLAATNGVATFAGCKITGQLGSYTLTASAPGLTGPASTAFNITIGPASQLVFSAQPGGGTDGAAWTNQPAVTIQDVGGNTVTTANNTVTLALGTNPGGTLACTGGDSLAATNGVATFAGCKITGKAGSYTLTEAATGGLTGPASTAFNITIGAASQLVFSAQPGGGANGAIWTAQPAVTIQDVGGNTVTTANNTVTLALGTNPGGTLACTGGDTLAATNGVATFAGCEITGKAGSYTLTEAATGGLTGPASTAFNITFGPASQLVFSAQPGGGTDGAAWTNQPAVTVEDASGNVVTNSAASVTLALGTNPGGTLACTGGDSLAATNGVATFAGCKITGKAGSYTLTEAATGGLTGPASTAFNITIGAASQLVFSAQPGGGANGAIWTAQPAVTIQDVGGNTVTTANNTVTLALGTNPGGTLACTGGDTLAATNGVATFAGCKITGKAGSYTLTEAATGGLTGPASTAFNITFGPASQLVFSAQPGGGTDGAAWTNQPAVTVEDASGNVVTNSAAAVTLALGTNPGGTLACTGGDSLAATNGVATFAGCKITGKAGSYTLTEAATGGLTGPASTAFNITFGPASQLVFSAQPGGGTDGAAWTNQPAVTVEDQSGNVVTNSAASVTLALGTNPGGTLACTGGDSLAATNGVATFAGCEITGTIGSYTLTEAATGGLTGPASTAFNITIGPASQLVFSAQPGGGTDGAAWTNQPAVTIQDVGGNTVTTANNTVTLALGTNPGGTLACTGGDSLAATNGVATFAGCKITGKAGSYTLTEAATGGLTGPASTAFNITIGAASQLVFSAQPGGGANGAIWTAQPAVTIQDVGGNTVTTANNTVTLALGTNPGGTLACTGGDTLAATNGVATFAGCKITGKAGSYTLTEAATGGLTGPASTAFNITFGPASQLVFSAQPGGGTDGAAWTNQPAVTVEDASGNVVTNSAAAVTLALGTNPGGTLACTGGDSLAATNGVATFAGCKITGKAGSYTLTEAATGGLTGPASTAFNITFGPASQLVFSAQPGGGANGAIWTAQPAVTIQDVGGNTVTTANNTVTLALGTNPGGTLACTGGDTLAATNGVATFAGCKITGKAGSYTLTEAATGGLTGPASTAFNITIGPASQLVFSAQPGGGTDGAAWTNQPAVTVEDASGNVVTNSAASVTLALGTNPGGTLACAGGDTLAATNGVATFAGCEITGKAGSYTLTEAATGGLTGPASTAFNITFGPASQLVFSAQPGGGTDGAAWTNQPAVTVEDQSGNVVTNSAASVTLALGTNPGGTLACTGGDSLAATNGVATFAGCKITGKAGSYTLTEAATGGLTGPASTAFNITIGAASQLVFSAQPGGGANGAIWTAQPAVTIQDVGGNTVTTANNTVTLALGTNPGGTLACTGGDTLAATNGVATFAGCKITGKAGSYTLTEAATGGLTGPASTAFNITFGPASQLVFSAQPGGGTDGAAWTNQPAVTVEDASGNVVTNSAAAVTLALGTNPGGTLACAGGDTLAATNGVATFAGCEITGKAGSYTLTEAATGGLTGPASTAFNITFGPASQLVFSAQPGGGTDGAAWTNQPAVTVEDQSGNVVTNSAASVDLAIGTQPGTGANLACTTNPLTPTNGVATLSGCEITGTIGSYKISAAATGLTGSTSTAFNITIGAASQLVFTTQPGGASATGVDGAAWTTQPKVAVEDVGGNTVTTAMNSITLAIATQPGTGATLVCTGTGTNGDTFAAVNGVATATGCKITGTIGSYTLNATVTGLTGATSTPISITIGGASQLAFTTQPGGGASGAVWATQPKVSIEDAGGNPVGAGTNAITLAIATQPGTGATLVCTGTGTGGDTFAAVNGVATATGCKITNGTTAGAYTISAAATGLTTGDSASLVVYGVATQLAFTIEPGGGTNGVVWTTQPVVSVEDASGDVVANSAASITLAIASKPNGGGTDTLTCSGTGANGDTFAATNGVASISGCEITGRTGTYTISATSNPLTGATSTGFTS